MGTVTKLLYVGFLGIKLIQFTNNQLVFDNDDFMGVANKMQHPYFNLDL